MGTLLSCLHLPPSDRRLALKAGLLLGLVSLGLRLASLHTVHRTLTHWAKALPPSSPAAPDAVERIGQAVEAASRKLPRHPACLSQALTVQWLIWRSGLPAELHIGVAKISPDKLDAHAWVESGGVIVIGGPEQKLKQYTRLTSSGRGLP